VQIETVNIQGKTPVTVMALTGELDASNFESVIAKARQLYAAGTRHILLDMEALQFMSSAGLVALHSIVLIMRGEEPHDPTSGWNAFHAMDHDSQSGPQPFVKILNPQPKVANTLQKTGMDQFFPVFSQRETALAAF
jgi:anti-anti-sigma regulatory factor